MDVLEVLERKVVSLLEYIGKLKADNEVLVRELEHKKADLSAAQQERAQLIEQNSSQCNEIVSLKEEICSLKQTLESLESAVLETRTSNDQEKALTKMLVEDLISSIDSLVEQER